MFQTLHEISKNLIFVFVWKYVWKYVNINVKKKKKSLFNTYESKNGSSRAPQTAAAPRGAHTFL